MSSDGIVIVDEYDTDGTTGLNAAEIQCAIDCLDGDPDPQEMPAAGWAGLGDGMLGGKLVFSPGTTYRIDAPLILPIKVEGSLIFEGNGAVLVVGPESGATRDPDTAVSFPAFGKIPASVATGIDVLDTVEGSVNWRFENLIFERASGGDDWLVKGIEIHGAQRLTVVGCRFERLDVGIQLNTVLTSVTEDCTFVGSRIHDVAVLGDFCPQSRVNGAEYATCWVQQEAVFEDAEDCTIEVTDEHGATTQMDGKFTPWTHLCRTQFDSASPGSHGAKVRRTRHSMASEHANLLPQAVFVQKTLNVSIEETMFWGARPYNDIGAWTSDNINHELYISNFFADHQQACLAFPAANCQGYGSVDPTVASPLIQIEQDFAVQLSNVRVSTDQDDHVLGWSATNLVAVENMPLRTEHHHMSAPLEAQVHFTAVGAPVALLDQDAGSDNNWLVTAAAIRGGVANTNFPYRIAVDNPDLRKLPVHVDNDPLPEVFGFSDLGLSERSIAYDRRNCGHDRIVLCCEGWPGRERPIYLNGTP